MQLSFPAVGFTGSGAALAVVVAAKSILFIFFCRGLTARRAAAFMFLGNVLTSVVGGVAAIMIGNTSLWLLGIPLVFLLSWLPSKRLSAELGARWGRRWPRGLVAAVMTGLLVASCALFAMSGAAAEAGNSAAYWVIKLAAIYAGVIASLALTTVWEEWAIWRLAGSIPGAGYFPAVTRTNLYVLLALAAFGAVTMLPQALKDIAFW